MSSKTIIDTGRALHFWLKQKGMTQGDIMRATGLERSYISRLASNTIRYPRLQTLEKLTQALGISLVDFIKTAIDHQELNDPPS
jgi:transcriptional regulator with XRE-family HTH domain